MLIDCDTCQVRGLRCGDCVVTVLLSRPAHVLGGHVHDDGAHGDGDHGELTLPHDLDASERAALAALADGGLIPPLRLVSGG